MIHPMCPTPAPPETCAHVVPLLHFLVGLRPIITLVQSFVEVAPNPEISMIPHDIVKSPEHFICAIEPFACEFEKVRVPPVMFMEE